MNGEYFIEGRFYPPQSSDGCDGTLRVAGDDIYASVFNEGREAFAREDMRIEPRIGTMLRKIYLPNGFMFETEDANSVDAIDVKKRWKILARLEKTGWHLIPFAILTPVLAIAFYRMMIPLLVSAGLFFTPDGLPKRIDKGSLASLDRIWMRPTQIDTARQAELTAMFEGLVAARPESRNRRVPEYELKFRKMRPPMPNAFALPGGTVILTDSLVRDFDNDDVLAGIIAHEIAHVEYEHSLRQIYRAIGMAALINMIAGDAGPMLEDVLLEGSALLSLSFSRKHELQADSYSVPLMKTVGRRPDAILAFFEALESGKLSLPKPVIPIPESEGMSREDIDDMFPADVSGPVELDAEFEEKRSRFEQKENRNWFSSHPLHQERIDNIKRLTGQSAPPPE